MIRRNIQKTDSRVRHSAAEDQSCFKGIGNNKIRAAEILQVSYKTLLTKIKEYRLEE
jgi:DNA-binding NtrC family response regulator